MPRNLGIKGGAGLHQEYVRYFKDLNLGSCSTKYRDIYWGYYIPIMQNQMEKKMENEMETGIIRYFMLIVYGGHAGFLVPTVEVCILPRMRWLSPRRGN